MSKKGGLVLGAGLVSAAIAGYALVVRPWHLRWGTRAGEAQLALPGDELVPQPMYESTRAMTIHAPASRVWQWLVQIGVGRGGDAGGKETYRLPVGSSVYCAMVKSADAKSRRHTGKSAQGNSTGRGMQSTSGKYIHAPCV